MNPQHSKVVARFAAAGGALATIGAIGHAAGSASSLLSGFTVWALLPYLVLLASSRVAVSRGRALTVAIIAPLVSAFALFFWADALFVHTTSTSPLVFLFVPLYQLIASLILLTALFFSRPSKAGSSSGARRRA